MTVGDDRPSGLGPEWVRGADGLLSRSAARVLLLDEDDRVLLLRGHDVDQPERSWWFTVGGGIDPGEDSRSAALRELREETGIVLGDEDLVGPVYRRSAVFDFYRAHCRQHELFYLARVGGPAPQERALDHRGWTQVEMDTLDEIRWWHLEDLDRVDQQVFPEGLPDLVRALLPGWDGVVRDLGLGRG